MTHLSPLSEASRSPYVVGTALGLLNVLAFATANRGLGVTSAFESAAALAARRFAPDALRANKYLQAREELPKVDWETFLVLGMLGGSYLAARASRERAPRSRRFRLPSRTRDASPVKRSAIAFLGGAVMMFGARMAKGCTSGHAITGTMQLALSSWVFTPVMFASATAVARALHGKGGR